MSPCTITGTKRRAAIPSPRCGRPEGRRVLVQADASDYRQIESAVDEAAEALGKLDIVVANGANALVGSFFDDDAVEVFESIVHTHLFGYFYTAKAAARHLKKYARSDVIFISSNSSQQFWADEWAYCTAKNGINALCKCISKDANRLGHARQLHRPVGHRYRFSQERPSRASSTWTIPRP